MESVSPCLQPFQWRLVLYCNLVSRIHGGLLMSVSTTRNGIPIGVFSRVFMQIVRKRASGMFIAIGVVEVSEDEIE